MVRSAKFSSLLSCVNCFYSCVSVVGVSPATFNGQSSYIRYANTLTGSDRKWEVGFRLRTRATSGVVLHVAALGAPFAPHLSLEMLKSGALQLK